jgi:hypothetical protein
LLLPLWLLLGKCKRLSMARSTSCTQLPVSPVTGRGGGGKVTCRHVGHDHTGIAHPDSTPLLKQGRMIQLMRTCCWWHTRRGALVVGGRVEVGRSMCVSTSLAAAHCPFFIKLAHPVLSCAVCAGVAFCASQKALVTPKQQKTANAFPRRKFALKA